MTDLSSPRSLTRFEASGMPHQAAWRTNEGDAAGNAVGNSDNIVALGSSAPEVSDVANSMFVPAPSSAVGATPRPPELGPVVSRLLAFCEGTEPRVIGISSDRRGSGVSIVARELARGYVEVGRTVYLGDASILTPSHSSGYVNDAPFDVRGFLRPHPHGYQEIDLAGLPASSIFTPSRLRDALSQLTIEGGVVVIDLPPISEADGTASTAALKVGAVCDAVFLVCLTGVVKSSEFCRCLMQCRAGRLKTSGIILNDWKLTASHLLPGS